jgi:translation initiation factor 2 subunit 1
MIEKKDFPDLDELVICTVTKIIGTAVFLHIEDYNKEGVMPFSEVAPGRIRNIRNYVAPNKKVVCKVLRIDKIKKHIDLSLRRVSVKDQKKKLSEHNRERANKILLNLVTDETNIDKIKEDFYSLNSFFEKLSEDETLAKKYLDKEKTEKLLKLIKEKEKERRVKITLKIKLQHSGPDGVEVIKKILEKNKRNAKITYISAPLYSITIESKNYKEGNRIIKEIAENIVDDLKQNKGKGEIIEK